MEEMVNKGAGKKRKNFVDERFWFLIDEPDQKDVQLDTSFMVCKVYSLFTLWSEFFCFFV